MFQVKHKLTGLKFEVCAVRDTGGKHGAEFLIFRDWHWQWIPADEFLLV